MGFVIIAIGLVRVEPVLYQQFTGSAGDVKIKGGSKLPGLPRVCGKHNIKRFDRQPPENLPLSNLFDN
jgi:hypothetical protein